jgi:hypothetical protein
MLIGGLALIVAGILSGDLAGLVLLLCGGGALAAFGAGSLISRPRLAIVSDGLRVRTIAGSTSYTRNEIVRIRIVKFPRFGRKVAHLELEFTRPESESTGSGSDTRLVVFGRWDLGTAPADVADALRGAGLRVDAPRD